MQLEIRIVGKLILYQKDSMVSRFYQTHTIMHMYVIRKQKRNCLQGQKGLKGGKRSDKNVCVDASHTCGSVDIYLSQIVPGQSWEQSLRRLRKLNGVINLCTWDEAHTSYQAPSVSYSTLLLTFL